MIVSGSRSPNSRAGYNRDQERGRATTLPPIDQRNSAFADRRWFVDAARSVVARPARESPGMALNAIPFCAVQPHAQIPYHDLEAIRQSA